MRAPTNYIKPRAAVGHTKTYYMGSPSLLIYLQVHTTLYVSVAYIAGLQRVLNAECASFQAKSHSYNMTSGALGTPSLGAGCLLDYSGREVFKAFCKWMVLHAAASETPARMVVVDGGGGGDRARASWDEQSRICDANWQAQVANDPVLAHRCSARGCGHLVNGLEYRQSVCDGLAKLTMHCCAERGCAEDPVNAQALFCYQHGVTQGFEKRCAIYIDAATGFCSAPVQPGSKCCTLPAHQALEARLRPAQTYRAARRVDQSKAAYELEEKHRLQERGRHRFAKCYTPVVFFYITICGIVHSLASEYNEEAHADILAQFKRTYPLPSDQPAYLFYDSNCSFHRALSPASPAGAARVYPAGRQHAAYGHILQRTAFLVDRFHFHGHHKGDEWCCLYCNPYALGLTGLVEVLSKTEIVPAARSNNEDENGTIGRKFSAVNAATGKSETHRMIRQVDPADGKMYEFVVRDHGNSPICEQTFVHFGGFKTQCKTMRASWARMYLKSMRDAWNMARTEAMERDGQSPTPASSDLIPELPPPRWWQLAIPSR